jgi:tRNA-dependent cyclodipeptide synthase
MSPGNAFFTRKRIEIAVCGMARLFGEVTVVVPDTIAVHTYRALGYDERQSRTKARENGLNIKNRCLRAMERARIESPSTELRILDWERDVTSSPGYGEAYDRVCALFDTNECFRKDVLNKGRSVLSAKLGEEAVTYTAVREGVEYLLKEFAYFSLFRNVFGRDVVVPYHQDFTLGQRFCDGGYHDPLPGVGWLIYEIEVAGEGQFERGVSHAI